MVWVAWCPPLFPVCCLRSVLLLSYSSFPLWQFSSNEIYQLRLSPKCFPFHYNCTWGRASKWGQLWWLEAGTLYTVRLVTGFDYSVWLWVCLEHTKAKHSARCYGVKSSSAYGVQGYTVSWYITLIPSCTILWYAKMWVVFTKNLLLQMAWNRLRDPSRRFTIQMHHWTVSVVGDSWGRKSYLNSISFRKSETWGERTAHCFH